jgi:hypothetical protein
MREEEDDVEVVELERSRKVRVQKHYCRFVSSKKTLVIICV